MVVTRFILKAQKVVSLKEHRALASTETEREREREREIQATYQSAKIIPDLADIRIDTNSTRVSVQGIAVLIDLIIKNTNRTPESRIPAISVDSLLICFVCLGVFLLRHVAASKKVPALRVIGI